MSTSTTQSRSAKDIEFKVDPDAPLFVAGAVLVSAALGATTGAIYGATQRVSPIHFAMPSAVKCGILGMAFFGSREYVISPILNGLREASASREGQGQGQAQGSGVGSGVGQVRSLRVLDSAIAGAVAGGGLSFGLRGPRTALPAAFTSALVASIAQFGVNEVRVQRLKLLERQARKSAPAPAVGYEGDLPALPSSVAEALEDNVKAPGAKRGDSPLTQRVLDKLTAVLPIQRISDDDFVATMEKRKSAIDKRLKEIDQEQLALFERSADETRSS